MGLGSDLAREIIRLKSTGCLQGVRNVIEIGAQQLSNDFLRATKDLNEVFRLFNRPTISFGPPIDAGNVGALEHQAANAPSSQLFWEGLGFEYAAIDFDGHRHSCPLDLNREEVPQDWRHRFDLVVNLGTTEHVANQDNCFRVIHDLVRPGGIMIHEVPAGGMLTHGLITYTMKFFWHLCRENSYQVLRLEMRPGGIAPLPDDILYSNAQYGGGGRAALDCQAEPIRDWTTNATLRKLDGAAYVTPLDLPAEIMPKPPYMGTRRRLERIWHRLMRV